MKFQENATDRETEAVLHDVLRLPEVRSRETSLGLKQGISGGGLSGGEEHPIPKQPIRIQFNMEHLSLQDIFDRIIQASPKGVWVYRESDCKGEKTYVVQMASD